MGTPAPHPEIARHLAPNELKGCAKRRLECVLHDQATSGHTLHETAPPRTALSRIKRALGGVVASLRQLDKVLPAIRQLGRRHAGYGVRPEHYATVGEALMWTLEQGLGADFTPAARRAWVDAYAGLAWMMIAAAEEDEALAQAA